MKSILGLLLGITLFLSIVFAGASNLPAEIVKGEVKYAAAAAQVFMLRANDGRMLLVSWDKKTTLRNLKNPDEIKADDYLIVEFTRQNEQIIASAIAIPEIIMPPGIEAAAFATIVKFADSSAVGEHLTLIDTRPTGAYDAGHIPGAISIPFERIAKRTAGLLPADKRVAVAFYDDGGEADSAVKAAELTIKSGYTRVTVFKEGARGWVKAGKFLACSATFIRRNKPALIDLRSPDKVLQGHIEGAVNYPLANLEQMYGNFPSSRRALLVVYGESDRDALAGAAIMRKWGYKNVTIFSGGAAKWSDNAEALESGPAAEYITATETGHSGQLQPYDFKMALQSPQMVEIVDVRSDSDHRKGHLEIGVHIPLQSLVLRHKELDREKIQVVFAADAEHAELAGEFLRTKGYRISFLGGTIEFGKNGEYTVK